jgi:ATP-dependent Clp protease ATP-binding subunit ClpC
VENGFDQILGARPLKRAIQKYIEDPLADEILKGRYSNDSVIKIKMKNKNELGFYEVGKNIDVKE